MHGSFCKAQNRTYCQNITTKWLPAAPACLDAAGQVCLEIEIWPLIPLVGALSKSIHNPTSDLELVFQVRQPGELHFGIGGNFHVTLSVGTATG